MRFTGERVIPGDDQNKHLYLEHYVRYMYAGQFVSGQKVLDLGCGTGYGAEFLARQGAKYVIGVDISNEAIDYANSNYQERNLSYTTNDCQNIGFQDESFDVVVSFEVIEHIDRWQTYLAEVVRVLRPGGYFIGSTPNKQLHSPDIAGSHNPFHIREYSVTDLRKMFSTYFENVWILGQSPLQGFLISEQQSLKHITQKNLLGKGVEPIVEACNGSDGVENGKDIVFVCRKEDSAQPERNLAIALPPAPEGKIYISEPIGVDYMRAVQVIRAQQEAINQLNNRITALNNVIIGFQKGRFIRFMAWLHKVRGTLFTSSRRNVDD